jgi:hypothetical protein
MKSNGDYIPSALLEITSGSPGNLGGACRTVCSASLHLDIQYFLYFGRNAPMLS